MAQLVYRQEATGQVVDPIGLKKPIIDGDIEENRFPRHFVKPLDKL